MKDVRCQCRSAPASCARLQSRQYPVEVGNPGAHQGLVTDQVEGEASQDRRKGGEPRALHHLPDRAKVIGEVRLMKAKVTFLGRIALSSLTLEPGSPMTTVPACRYQGAAARSAQRGRSSGGCQLSGAFLCTGACMAKDERSFARLALLVALASAITATPLRNSVTAGEIVAFMTGNQLWDACNRPDAYGGYCGGYIAGAADLMSAETPHPTACFPHGVGAEQLVNVVKLYLSQHPAKRHFGAFEVIFLALFSAFPCAP